MIVIEGIDGSGKSTQARYLLETLKAQGFDAVSFREPSDSTWGRKIKKKALHSDSLTPQEELELFVKDRRENVERNLKPALKAKKIVVLDRYYYSTISYQGAKGIDPEQIRLQNEIFAPRPDIVFILDVDPSTGLKRIEGRKQRMKLFEQEEYLKMVRKIFQSFQGSTIFHIDAGRDEEKVREKIESIVFKFIREKVKEDIN